MIRRRAAAVFALVLLAAFAAAPSALAESASGTVIANDGVPIAYEVAGDLMETRATLFADKDDRDALRRMVADRDGPPPDEQA